MSRTAARLAAETQGVIEAADRQNRALTTDERLYVQDLLDRAQERGELQKSLDALGPSLGMTSAFPAGQQGFAGGFAADDPGSRFVNSEGFKAIRDPASRGKSFTTGMIEVGGSPLGMKGTLTEGAGSPGSGTGGGLLPVPQVVPGVVQKLFQPLTLEALLGANQTTGNTVRYILEGTATSGPAGVAEAGTKPESTLGLSTIDEPIPRLPS